MSIDNILGRSLNFNLFEIKTSFLDILQLKSSHCDRGNRFFLDFDENENGKTIINMTKINIYNEFNGNFLVNSNNV